MLKDTEANQSGSVVLKRESATAHLLGLPVRIPSESLMSVCCVCCVLSGKGLWV